VTGNTINADGQNVDSGNRITAKMTYSPDGLVVGNYKYLPRFGIRDSRGNAIQLRSSR
jgi:hypothetical protein